MNDKKSETLALDMTLQAYKQFLLLKEKHGFKGEDFAAFAIGYTFGVYATASTIVKSE